MEFDVDVRNGPGQSFDGKELSNFAIQAFGFNLANNNGAGPEADNIAGRRTSPITGNED